jgi:hypothetical protein
VCSSAESSILLASPFGHDYTLRYYRLQSVTRGVTGKRIPS